MALFSRMEQFIWLIYRLILCITVRTLPLQQVPIIINTWLSRLQTSTTIAGSFVFMAIGSTVEKRYSQNAIGQVFEAKKLIQ